MDFCKDPEVICRPDGPSDLKWVAGFFYWLESVQPYDVDRSGGNYMDVLRAWVDNGMNPNDNSLVDFGSGVVNRGCFDAPHEGSGGADPCGNGEVHAVDARRANFRHMLSVFAPAFAWDGTGTAAPATAAPITAAPASLAPVTAAPGTAAPGTAAPVTAAPVTTSPVTATPVTAGPGTPPVTVAPVTAAPVTAAPVTAAPVTAAPGATPVPVLPPTPSPAHGSAGCAQAVCDVNTGGWVSCGQCASRVCHCNKMLQCPAGLYWNMMAAQCDWPSVVGCSPLPPSVPADGSCSQAVCDANGRHGGLVGCGVCSGKFCNADFLMDCPAGLHWNCALSVCDWPRNTGCA